MAANLLSIAETSHETEIDEEKLRFICSKANIWDHYGISKSKANIWDHYGISKSQYDSLNYDEKLKMLKGFYKNLIPVYFGNDKRKFCCNDCIWFDDGRKQ